MNYTLTHLSRNGPFLKLKRDIANGSLKDVKYGVQHGFIDFRNDVYTNIACGCRRLAILKYLIHVGCKVNVFECIKSMLIRDMDIFPHMENRRVHNDSLFVMVRYFLPKYCTPGKTFSLNTLIRHGIHDMYTGSILSGDLETVSLLVKYFGTKNFSVYTHASATTVLFLLRKGFPVYNRDYRYIFEMFGGNGAVVARLYKRVMLQKGIVYGDISHQDNFFARNKNIHDDESFFDLYRNPWIAQNMSNELKTELLYERDSAMRFIRYETATAIQKAYRKHYDRRMAAAKKIKNAATRFLLNPSTRRAYFPGRTVDIYPSKIIQTIKNRSIHTSPPRSVNSHPIHINTQNRVMKPRPDTSFLKEFATVNKLYKTRT